jgi:hypothetical protein
MKTESNKNNRNDSWPTKMFVYSVLALWFFFALMMSAEGKFATQKTPVALGLSFALPIVFFVLAYFGSKSFRAFCNALDLSIITGLHMWRILGLDFMMHYFEGNLPAGFALPAGLGDTIIAVTALPMAIGISRHGVIGKRFVAWNIFGLLDLFTAVGLGIMFSKSTFGVLAGAGPDTYLMSVLPLSLVPTFLVPIFILLHLLALSRRKEVTVQSGVPNVVGQHS